MNEYTKQAEDFCQSTGTRISLKFLEYNSMPWDLNGERRNIYRIRLQVGRKSHTMTFGQSIVASNRNEDPSAYDVLSCLCKADPGTFEDFCADMGFDTDSIRARDSYRAVQKEWKALERLYTEDQRYLLSDIN